MTLTPFNKLAIPITPFFNLTFSVAGRLTGNENTCMCTLEFPRMQRFTEPNAWTYIEVKKLQKAPTHKKLGVTIKTVLIVFDITYFFSLLWMMVKMVKWVTGLIMRTEWQGERRKHVRGKKSRWRDDAPGKQHYIPESMWAEKKNTDMECEGQQGKSHADKQMWFWWSHCLIFSLV